MNGEFRQWCGYGWRVLYSERCAAGAVLARALLDVAGVCEVWVLVIDGYPPALSEPEVFACSVRFTRDVAIEIAAEILDHLDETGYSLETLLLDADAG